MLCEMCGKDVASTARAKVEGSVLSVCPDCARFGQLLDPPPAAPAEGGPSRRPVPAGATRAAPRPRRMEERDLYTEIGEMELAPDWAKRVRQAREGHAWTPEDLGKKLNEKKSVVLKIEAGAFRPPDALVRKLEQLLKVRLRADPEPGPG
ncbi:MAG TPA: multiprotein bridging factor aMBF1 [Thermoplasmata archaeon]|nr:multiprotein bridging factor aMBF1 [Thermoplasmata archaeon]